MKLQTASWQMCCVLQRHLQEPPKLRTRLLLTPPASRMREDQSCICCEFTPRDLLARRCFDEGDWASRTPEASNLRERLIWSYSKGKTLTAAPCCTVTIGTMGGIIACHPVCHACVCLNMYTSVHMYACMFVCKYIYICTARCVCIYIQTHVHV